MKNQKGFGLLGLMLAVGFLSIIFAMNAKGLVEKQKYEQQVKPFYAKMLELKRVIEAYQIIQYKKGISATDTLIFPHDNRIEGVYDDLVQSGLVSNCSISDENLGKCSRILSTPWDYRDTYSGMPGIIFTYKRGTSGSISYPYIEVIFSLPRADQFPTENKLYEIELSKLPKTRINQEVNATIDGLPTKIVSQIAWRIDVIPELSVLDVDGPDPIDPRYLTSNGQTPLNQDWDVGNKAVLNASAVSVRLSNGKQQRLDAGMSGYLLGWNGRVIEKHSCAQGLTPDLVVSPKDLQAWSTWAKYSASGAYRVGHRPHGSGWILYLEHNVKRVQDNKWWKINDGYLNVLRICRK